MNSPAIQKQTTLPDPRNAQDDLAHAERGDLFVYRSQAILFISSLSFYSFVYSFKSLSPSLIEWS